MKLYNTHVMVDLLTFINIEHFSENQLLGSAPAHVTPHIHFTWLGMKLTYVCRHDVSYCLLVESRFDKEVILPYI